MREVFIELIFRRQLIALFLLALLFAVSGECRELTGPDENIDLQDLYRLRVTDRLNFHVDMQNGTERLVAVDPNGAISYMTVNSWPVAGKTIPEVRVEIENILGKFYSSPDLFITPQFFCQKYYTVIGQVAGPGIKPLVGKTTLTNALCVSGGFNNRIFNQQTYDLVDLEKSFLARRGEYVPVDFKRLLKYGDMRFDLELEEGDYIFFADNIPGRVHVLGEVLFPSRVEFYGSITLAEAISRAGGTTYRAGSRVGVIRGSLHCPEKYLVDFNRIQKGFAGDFELEPGDIVYVSPMCFTTLKEIIQGGISAFVAQAASNAGTNLFIKMTPSATNVVSPVPVIGNNGAAAQAATPASGL